MVPPRTYRARPAIDRFLEKVAVDPATGCWNWQAAIHPRSGYGSFGYGRKPNDKMGMVLAHRFAYQHYKGEIAEGLEIDHLCRNRRCVNPDHLEAVTRRVNQLRGESVSARAARVTHCPNGHPYDEGNTARSKAGARICKQCRRDTARTAVPRYLERKKAMAQGREIPPWAMKRP